MSKYRELDLSGVTRFPFAERPTKVDVSMFGKPDLDDDSFAAFFAAGGLTMPAMWPEPPRTNRTGPRR